MTITLAYDVAPEAILAVQQLVSREVLHNPNLNGTTVVYRRGDYTCIDHVDDRVGTILLHQITDTIDGRVL